MYVKRESDLAGAVAEATKFGTVVVSSKELADKGVALAGPFRLNREDLKFKVREPTDTDDLPPIAEPSDDVFDLVRCWGVTEGRYDFTVVPFGDGAVFVEFNRYYSGVFRRGSPWEMTCGMFATDDMLADARSVAARIARKTPIAVFGQGGLGNGG